MREAVDSSGSGEDLEQDVGDVRARHYRPQLLPFVLKIRWIGRRPEPVEADLPVLDHRVAIRSGDLGRDLPVGVIERHRERLKVRLGLGGKIERLEHPRLGRLPLLAVQQPGAWVAPPIASVGVDLAVAQTAMQLLEHAEGVRAVIGHARRELGVSEHQPAPGAGDQRRIQLIGEHLLAVHQRRQAPECSQNRRARSDRAELKLREQPEEAGHRAIALDQLSAPFRITVTVVLIGDQLLELLERACQLIPRDRLLDPVPRLCQRDRLARVLGYLQQHAERPGDLRCRAPQCRQGFELGLVALPLSARQQLRGHQQVEQVKRVIDRVDLQLADRRQQRSRTALRGKLPQRRRLRRQPIAGERGELRWRHIRQLDAAGSQRLDR